MSVDDIPYVMTDGPVIKVTLPNTVLILEIPTWADLAVSSFDSRDHVLECKGRTGSTGVNTKLYKT